MKYLIKECPLVRHESMEDLAGLSPLLQSHIAYFTFCGYFYEPLPIFLRDKADFIQQFTEIKTDTFHIFIVMVMLNWCFSFITHQPFHISLSFV